MHKRGNLRVISFLFVVQEGSISRFGIDHFTPEIDRVCHALGD
jgi:hypothetical protein